MALVVMRATPAAKCSRHTVAAHRDVERLARKTKTIVVVLDRRKRVAYANRAEAANDIADYIVGFYNSIRLHSKLGNLSPNAFERESEIQQPIDVSEIT